MKHYGEDLLPPDTHPKPNKSPVSWGISRDINLSYVLSDFSEILIVIYLYLHNYYSLIEIHAHMFGPLFFSLNIVSYSSFLSYIALHNLFSSPFCWAHLCEGL